MISLIDRLSDENIWLNFLEFKKNQKSLSKQELTNLEYYISNKKYLHITNDIIAEKYTFSIPTKHLINKINNSKKRVVYSFTEDENYVLKLISFLFSAKYDKKYSKNCYSFRHKKSVKDAIKTISSVSNLGNIYGYKVDISNYFNSINIDILLKKLKSFVGEDIKLYEFISKILLDDRVLFDGKLIHEQKGIMAGVPISSFLANIYLNEVDDYFLDKDIIYLRYSDDILLLSNGNSISEYSTFLKEKILENKLQINLSKELYIYPGDSWDFLGFKFKDDTIDISDIAKKKIKEKIKRACRKIHSWMIKKEASPDRAISAIIRKFNKKFYMIDNATELTWSLWYFPSINTDKSLREIDQYMQQELRYIATGKHGKKNYNITYSDLKKLGYRPLVSEYYKYKKRNKIVPFFLSKSS